jgi:hypothetical protein
MARIIRNGKGSKNQNGKGRDTRAVTPEKHAAFLVRQARREKCRLAFRKEEALRAWRKKRNIPTFNDVGMFVSLQYLGEDVEDLLHTDYRNPYYRDWSLAHADNFGDVLAYFAIPIAKFIEVHLPILEKILVEMDYKSIWDLLKEVIRCLYNDYVILKNENTSRVGCNQPVIFLKDVLQMNGTLVINGLYHVMASGFYRCLSVIIEAFDGPQSLQDFDDMVAKAQASANTTDPEHRLFNLSQEIAAIDAAHDLAPFPKDAFVFTGLSVNFRVQSLIRSCYCR